MHKPIVGQILFWFSWPLVWIYSPLFLRSRVFVVHNGKFLTVKGWFGPGDWQLPGGGKKNSESKTECAIRELNEETGIEIKEEDMKELYSDKFLKWHGLIVRYSCYRVDLDKMPQLQIRYGELVDYKWFPLSAEADNYGPDVAEALDLLA